jgi:hypothetical protein
MHRLELFHFFTTPSLILRKANQKEPLEQHLNLKQLAQQKLLPIKSLLFGHGSVLGR